MTRPASACRFVVPPPRCHPSGAFRRLPLDRPGSPTRTRFTLQLVAVEPRRRSAPGSDWRLAGWARGAAPAPGASHRPSRRGRAGSARFRSRLVSPGARRISAVRNAELHVFFCDGTNEVPCINCDGTHEVPCINCDGTHEVPCINCDGTNRGPCIFRGRGGSTWQYPLAEVLPPWMGHFSFDSRLLVWCDRSAIGLRDDPT